MKKITTSPIVRGLAWSVAGLAMSASSAFALDCPNSSSAADLNNWRTQLAPGLSQGDQSTTADAFTRCFPAPATIPACLQRAEEYATRDDLGSGYNDVTFDQEERKRPPAELYATMNGVSGYYIRPDIEALAREKGWLTARYKSRHAGGFDSDTPSLLMLYVPGSTMNPPVNYDRWLNFPLPKDNGSEEMNPVPQAILPTEADYANENNSSVNYPSTFTMVTIERKVGEKPSEIYFQMFNRQNSNNKIFTPQGNVSVTSCYSCHMNGLRAISPLGYHVRAGERQMPAPAWKAVKAMNDSMEDAQGNAPASWRSVGGKQMFKPNAHGPIIGPVTPLNPVGRTEEFIKSCQSTRTTIYVTDIFGRAPGRNNIYTQTTTADIDWKKVKRAMNCASCHNGVQRGALNGRADWSQLDFKMLVDQSMPMGWHMSPLDQGDDANVAVVDRLNNNERIALSNCLQAEYRLEQQTENVEKWLNGVACE